MTPMISDQTTAMGSDSMPASTKAARGTSMVVARVKSATPPVPVDRLGEDGATPASPAATIQAIRVRLRTGMPSSWARSTESAAPRMATPVSVRMKNQ